MLVVTAHKLKISHSTSKQRTKNMIFLFSTIQMDNNKLEITSNPCSHQRKLKGFLFPILPKKDQNIGLIYQTPNPLPLLRRIKLFL